MTRTQHPYLQRQVCVLRLEGEWRCVSGDNNVGSGNDDSDNDGNHSYENYGDGGSYSDNSNNYNENITAHYF